MSKPDFFCAKTKTQISCAVTAQLISAFVLAKQIVESHFFLNPKFQISSPLLRVYRSVCARSGRKPRLVVFPRELCLDSAEIVILDHNTHGQRAIDDVKTN